jgi:hypothetical protein
MMKRLLLGLGLLLFSVASFAGTLVVDGRKCSDWTNQKYVFRNVEAVSKASPKAYVITFSDGTVCVQYLCQVNSMKLFKDNQVLTPEEFDTIFRHSI